MMWEVTLIFVCYLAAQVASHEIKVECHEFHDFPPFSDVSPSPLLDLKGKLVTVEKQQMLNISWAIHIDGSTKYLTATRIEASGNLPYHCKYNPPFAEAPLAGSEQIWFHYLLKARPGIKFVQASNLPRPMSGSGYPCKSVTVAEPVTEKWEETTTSSQTTQSAVTDTENTVDTDYGNFTSIAAAIFGGLTGLITLGCCFIIYKNYRAKLATLLGFKMLPTFPMVPVPVLVVYPAENSAFQRAVVALVEFLQWHGGCSVAVDMWQQGKIAELGPLRWLAEQAKAADRVLIVCPQTSSQPNDSPSDHSIPVSSIPAATYDLYPLILNMVASHAKSVSELSKFWVVQLGEEQAKRPHNLALGLRACKTFYLMKDLIKLCRRLHSKRQDGKRTSDQNFVSGIDKSTVKLREAVEKLGGQKPSIFREAEPLKSVVTTI